MTDSVSNFRTKLPVEMSTIPFSMWQFMKSCIGKELTKIAMPIGFNEPLSFIQRVVEYLEFSDLLFKAAKSDDPVQRLEYIAAFVVSGASSNWNRTTKPFNPLHGETYELDRSKDLGFRVVCEQVSHHPPTSAFYAEATDGSWLFHGSVTPKVSFWGKTVDVTPKGFITLEFPKRGEAYTYQNVPCKAHNIIIGKLWVEHCGDVVITNHKTRYRCDLKWHSSSWFRSDHYRVTGYIFDGKGRKKKALYGRWMDSFYSVPLDSWRRFKRGGHRKRDAKEGVNDADQDDYDEEGNEEDDVRDSSGRSPEIAVEDDDQDDVTRFSPVAGADTDQHLPGQACLWRQRPRPDDSEKYFNYTAFALALNDDTDPDLMARLPPTDSRHRPDMRALENADGTLAQSEKYRLEEKQRQALKLPGGPEARLLWFKQWRNPHTGKDNDWKFDDKYWARDWTRCADLF